MVRGPSWRSGGEFWFDEGPLDREAAIRLCDRNACYNSALCLILRAWRKSGSSMYFLTLLHDVEESGLLSYTSCLFVKCMQIQQSNNDGIRIAVILLMLLGKYIYRAIL